MAPAARARKDSDPAHRPRLTVVPNTGFASDLEEVREFAQGLPERYLQCRDMGHNWKPFTAAPYRDGGFKRTLRCPRCKTKRNQELSHRGEVLSNTYVHPPGYLHQGMGRIVGDGRGLLRLESTMRVVGKG